MVASPIVIVSDGPMHPRELGRLADLYFEDRVKYVVDVVRGIAAVGGEMHADGQSLLLVNGSRLADLWGAVYWPGRGREQCAELSAPINVRPSDGNGSPEIHDPAIRRRVLELTWSLIGDGEALP
jgi:Protein of unknown function (DUF5674)